MTGRPCATCGCFHGKSACPFAATQQRQDPYRINPPRPSPMPLSDPALRDATKRTIFLIPARRIV